jgi:probable O-glycosylation ligase (exosortase A-associated)
MGDARIDTNRYDFSFWIIIAFVFFEFGRPQDWVPSIGSLRIPMVLQILCFLTLMTRLPKRLPKQAILIFLFLLIMTKSVPFALNNYFAFKQTQAFAYMFFGSIFPMMVFINSYYKMNRLIHIWIVVIIFVAVTGLSKGGGSGGFFGDENDFALLLNISIPFSFFLLFGERSKLWRIVLISSVGIFLLANTVSLSRGGFVGLIAVGSYCWFQSKHKAKATLVLAMAITLMVSFAPEKYWDEMRTIRTSTEKGDTGDERLFLWKLAWRMFLKDPVMGVGPSNFRVHAGLSDQYMTPQEIEERGETWGGGNYWGKVCHSTYFTILAEEGLPGVVLFFLIVYTFFKDMNSIIRFYARKRRREPSKLEGRIEKMHYLALGAKGSMIGFLSTGAFLTVTYYPVFWTLIAMSVFIKDTFEETVLRLSLEENRITDRVEVLGLEGYTSTIIC